MIRSIWLRQIQRRLFGFGPVAGLLRRDPRLRQERRCVRLLLESLEERITPAGPIILTAANAAQLQAAVTTVDANPTQQYIIQLTGPSPYNLTTDLNLTNTAGVTITGSSTDLIAAVESRVFQVDLGAKLTLQNLTIENGIAGQGAGINDKQGAVTLSTVVVQNNASTFQGGGVYVSGGSLTLKNSVIQNNKVIGTTGSAGLNGGSGEGGGIFATNASVIISGSTISNNLAQGGKGGDGTARVPAAGSGGSGEGGGLYIDAGTLTMNNTTLSHNTVQGGTGGNGFTRGPTLPGGNGGDSFGGGLYAVVSTSTLLNDTVASNSAKAGAGGLLFTPGPPGSSSGGGLYVLGGALNLTGSTVSGNTAINGGGMFETAPESGSATMTIINSTIALNTGVSNGAILVGSALTATIENSTIAQNHSTSLDTPLASGGIDFFGLTLNLVNSIVAKNVNSAGGSDLINDNELGGGTVNATNSLIQNPAPLSINGNNTNNIIGEDPLLGALGKNGGPTETMAIPATSPSPALAAGDATKLPAGLTTDQRGTGFARSINGKLDIGAFQVQAGQINFSPISVFFSFANQNVTLTATITAPGFASVTGGSVTFTVLGQTFTVPVVGGTASTTLTIPGGTPPGIYPIGIVYNGFSDLRGSSTTSTLTIEPLPTSVSSVSNINLPFTSADPAVTLTAVVATQGGAVNVGQVRFVVTNSSGTQLGQTVTANVSNGQASAVFDVPAETPVGAYTITANYMDPAGNLAVSSGAGTLTIATSPTTVTINNVNIVYGLFSEQETLTAVVYNALGQVVNEGFVTFTDSGQTETVPIVNSLATATLNIPIFFENPNAHPITVSYASNTGNFFASTGVYTRQETIIEYLFQILAVLELYLEISSANPAGGSAGT